MDYNKIGNFIMTERKARKLTQAKLAEKLFVSEKTISKWENGNGIPDTNLLQKLCEILEISVNELLNGERISNEEYSSKAEKKLLELQEARMKSDKRLLKIEIVLGVVSILLFSIIWVICAYVIEALNIYALPIVIMVISFVLLLISLMFCMYIEQKAGFYACKHCNHKYVPTLTQCYLAMHMGRTRYLKCPKCKKKSWNKKVLK